MKVDGGPRQAAGSARAAADPPATGAASNLLLRSGFVLGDTSLVAYFDGDVNQGDPSSWARWWATVSDVEYGE